MLKTVSSITNAIGALNYKGTWNASTNSPALSSGVGTKGDYYVVSVAGTTSLDGISNWGVGDWAAFNGSVWQRVEGGADVNGVNITFTGTASGPTYETSDLDNGLTIASNSITADGTNTNIDVNIAPKGTGAVFTSKSYTRNMVNAGTSGSPNADTALQYRVNGNNRSSVRFWNIAQNLDSRTWSSLDVTDDNGTLIAGVTPTPYDGVTMYGSIQPNSDGASSCGLSSRRWSVVYAATGTINTSDGNQKQQVADLTTQEKAVAVSIKSLIKTFKFNDAVDRKGDEARVHFGTTTQLVKEAFEQEGLDPNNYGLFCYDEWDYQPEIKDKDGVIVQKERQAGNAYGLRYDELICFILSAI